MDTSIPDIGSADDSRSRLRRIGPDTRPLGVPAYRRLFLGWGQVWCENVRPERARMLAQTNPHSPGRERVNGVVSNMPEFQKAFSCQAGAPMVRQTQCRVW